jgi:glycosyltransferase involved in cell wall biosynthesis
MLNLRLRHAGIPRRDAFLYYALADWGLLLRTAYIAAQTGVRIFQAEFPAYARVCLWVQSLLGGHTVLVEHNVEFDRLKAQVAVLHKRCYELLRQIEVTLCNRVELVIVVSRLDRETLLRNGVNGDRLFVVPHGVDLAASDAATISRDFLVERGIGPERPIMVYHGTYAYPPNLDAVHILAREIVPRLRVRGFDPLVLAIGPHAPRRNSLPNVVFLGSVAAVPPYLKAADVAVVPLQQGGGTRMKILDYFAAGVPVVTTPKGAEGLDLVDGRDALIRDGYDSIADAVACLLQDGRRASALGARGRQFAAALDWLSIGKRYRDLFVARSMLPADLSA